MPERFDVPKLITLTKNGLYCSLGDFYIDPYGQVDIAIITHAHADHARIGAKKYICHHDSVAILKKRLGDTIQIEAKAYNETFEIKGVQLSLHPAGHVLGSAQIRLEYLGEVWVVSGDYKIAADPTCTPFEHVLCDTFITESTFGLPVFKWQATDIIMNNINQWWQQNQTNHQPSLLGAYSFGKAQRVLAGIDNHLGPIYVHGAIENLLPAYQDAGVLLPDVSTIDLRRTKQQYDDALIIAPPSAINSSWGKRFKNANTAFASGWMQIRGNRRHRGVQRGFVLSDHADWPSLLKAIKYSKAQKIYTMHGYADTLSKYLCEIGIDAEPLKREAL
tara:strand:- start:915 stop:1913 length:999 start_codon:yes stop_codon:yes gene_type:complete